MARSKRSPQPPAEEVGPVRYSQERLFWGMEDDTIKELKGLWQEGEQLGAADLPEECLCVVIMMAAWARRQGVELVDDYDILLQRARDGMAAMTIHHPDLFFVSCICILHRREQEPTIGGFEVLNIPDHYEKLIGI